MESERIMKHINELESLVLESTKNSNKILQIEKVCKPKIFTRRIVKRP